MKILLFLFSISTLSLELVRSQQTDVEDAIKNIFSSDFLSNYEEVTPPPLESITALEKCGEGTQRNLYVCVPYYNCDGITRTVIREPVVDPTTLIDIRANDEDRKCNHFLDVCCRVSNETGTNGSPNEGETANTIDNTSSSEERVTPRTPNIRRPNTTTSTTTPRSTPDDRIVPKNPPQFCGIRNTNGIEFKITGNENNEAEFGEFPWMVAVMQKNQDQQQNSIGRDRGRAVAVCGGSLITPIVVLTGAHCVARFKTQDIKIRAGEWDTQTEKEPIPYQERDVNRIIVHENYSPGNVYNNMALLILDRALTKTGNIGTICLPSRTQTFNARNCIVTGWGKDQFGSQGKYSVILKKIQLPLVLHNECQRALRTTRLTSKFDLHRSFICAGGQAGVDACTGDGGSPLVCPDPNNRDRYYQVGIVAWGIGCGEDRIPGVYTDVTQFRSWVDQKLQEAQINTNPYIL